MHWSDIVKRVLVPLLLGGLFVAAGWVLFFGNGKSSSARPPHEHTLPVLKPEAVPPAARSAAALALARKILWHEGYDHIGDNVWAALNKPTVRLSNKGMTTQFRRLTCTLPANELSPTVGIVQALSWFANFREGKFWPTDNRTYHAVLWGTGDARVRTLCLN